MTRTYWTRAFFFHTFMYCVLSYYYRPPSLNNVQQLSTSTHVTSDPFNLGLAPADFLCYDDKTSVVIRDIPCPTESSLKMEASNQLLNFVLRGEGSGLLTPTVSSVAPDHLSGFDLHDIGSANWMNYNKSDLTIRLENSLQQFQENTTRLLNQLLQYLSSWNLKNVTTLMNLLFNDTNITTDFNMCANISVRDELFCNKVQTKMEALNCLNIQAQKLIASEDTLSNSVHINMNKNGSAEDTNVNSNITDISIDVLIQRLDRIKVESKLLVELHNKLLHAIQDFRKMVIIITRKFLISLVESGYQDIPSEIFHSFGAHLKIRRDNDDDIFDPQTSYRSNTNKVQPSTETSAAIPDTDKTTSFNLFTEELSSNTSLQQLNADASAKPETHQENGLLDHLVLSGTVESGTNVVNTTQDADQYFKEIFDMAFTLISSLTELIELLNESKSWQNEHDEILQNMTTWHNLRSRTRRDVTGYTIATDRCQRQGAIITQTNFISLCSTCVHATVLDNTYYPRYLTEKICSSGSSLNPAFRDGCLFQPNIFGGRPGGVCKQQEIHIIILQQVPGKCMKVISKGQEIITDQWQSTTHALRIGCECVVDQNSQYAMYAHIP